MELNEIFRSCEHELERKGKLCIGIVKGKAVYAVENGIEFDGRIINYRQNSYCAKLEERFKKVKYK